jgi:hypothetical protein
MDTHVDILHVTRYVQDVSRSRSTWIAVESSRIMTGRAGAMNTCIYVLLKGVLITHEPISKQ